MRRIDDERSKRLSG